MTELNEAAMKEYPDIPAVKNSPLIQKIQDVLSQEFLNKLSVRFRFGGIDSLAWKIRDIGFDANSRRTKLTPTPTY